MKIKEFVETALYDDTACKERLKRTMYNYLIDFALHYENLGGKKCDLTINQILDNWNHE